MPVETHNMRCALCKKPIEGKPVELRDPDGTWHDFCRWECLESWEKAADKKKAQAEEGARS